MALFQVLSRNLLLGTSENHGIPQDRLSPDRHVNPEPCRYELSVLSTGRRRSVSSYKCCNLLLIAFTAINESRLWCHTWREEYIHKDLDAKPKGKDRLGCLNIEREDIEMDVRGICQDTNGLNWIIIGFRVHLLWWQVRWFVFNNRQYFRNYVNILGLLTSGVARFSGDRDQ